MDKRVTIFAGHYGSGKTNIAVNYALSLASDHKEVVIADLDIVNPYFRTKDASEVLEKNGVKLVSSPYANTNVDTPALPAEAYAVIHNKDVHAVIDVGGDDRGALALGRFASAIVAENNYDMLFVINKYRYLTNTPEDTVEIMREIEDACSVKFTAIVNNSNLGDETTAENVLSSIEYAKSVANLCGLEIKMTTVSDKLMSELKGKVENLFPLKLYVKQFIR
jgi:septum formation inhibitor-activating ATPase MinD